MSPSGSGCGRARSRFHSGLLAWLRAPDDPAGLREMIAVLRDLTAAETKASGRVLWRSAETVLATILDSTLSVDDEALQICRRIEGHLTALSKGQAPDDGELRDALFGFASRRRPPPQPESPAIPLGALGATLGVAAELLPLIVGVGPKYPIDKVAAWLAAGERLEQAWHALPGSSEDATATEFRAAATGLVSAALDLDDAGCLRLAEGLASVGALAEERASREAPALRAAVAYALETALEGDGPNHKHFDQRAISASGRLEGALAGETGNIAPASAAHELKIYLGEAHEAIEELRLALHALPPDLVSLRQGAFWFARHRGPGKALRELGALLGDTLTQARHEEIDGPDGQRTIGAAIDALSAVLDQIAAGHPPTADEAVFAGLRKLAARKPRQTGRTR